MVYPVLEIDSTHIGGSEHVEIRVLWREGATGDMTVVADGRSDFGRLALHWSPRAKLFHSVKEENNHELFSFRINQKISLLYPEIYNQHF